MQRLYGLLHVKGIDADARVITGIASTATPDRIGDIVEPSGCTFHNPLPLLLHHDKTQPVGTAELGVSGNQILFRASLPFIQEAGALKDRVDEAWQSIKAGLLLGVSIGYLPKPGGIKQLKHGLHLLKTEVFELSLVTIPANVDATILAVKSLDAPFLAAAGHHPPGDTGRPIKVRTMANQTTAEQIQAFENSRAAKAARLSDIMQTAADAGTTLDDPQTQEYDGLELEIKSIDAHLVRLRSWEKTQIDAATKIDQKAIGQKAADQRSGFVSVKANVPPGTAFVRGVMALARANGDRWAAMEFAKQWHDSTPEVELMIKAAVAPATTTDPAWAGALVQVGNLTGEFIELLRPATILGKIPGLMRVPFNTKVPMQTSGGTYKWVGQAAAKPVTRFSLSTISLAMAKASGIIVLTEELVKLSNPSAEEIVRREMIAGIAAFLDRQFIDPTVTAVPGINPASITAGTTAITSTDDPLKDLNALIATFTAANVPLAGLTLIMSESNGFAMGFKRDAMGNRVFAGMSANGGSVDGITVITSNQAGDDVIALQPSRVIYADDGAVSIDVSREASVQMNDAPDSPATATSVFTSFFQDNLVGLRAERFINWERVQLQAVKYVDGADYTAPPA